MAVRVRLRQRALRRKLSEYQEATPGQNRLLLWIHSIFAFVLLTSYARFPNLHAAASKGVARTRLRRAALFARASLENRALPPAPPPSEPSVRPSGRLRTAVNMPLRFASHLFTIILVAVIICVAYPLSSWAGTSDAPVAITQVPPDSLVIDPQVVSSFEAFSVNASEDWVAPAGQSQSLAQITFLQTHEMQEGETLADVAQEYGVSVPSLFWANNLQNNSVLAVGQDLRIPRFSGVPHTVQPGETLSDIAAHFGVTMAEIVAFRGNPVTPGQPLSPGLELFIPSAEQAYPEDVLYRYGGEQGIAAMQAVLAGIVRENRTNLREGPNPAYHRVAYLEAGRPLTLVARHADWFKVDAGGAQIGWVRSDLLDLPADVVSALPETDDFPPPPPVWVWPTHGRLTSGFGYRTVPFRGFHDGIDIANRAGTLIVAARAGRVYEAGWCSGFGYCVKIDHGDGVETIYGHLLRQPSVAVGQEVEVGAAIGLMGSTYDRRGGGYSTGVHLHFTVKVNGKAVDPLTFLP